MKLRKSSFSSRARLTSIVLVHKAFKNSIDYLNITHRKILIEIYTLKGMPSLVDNLVAHFEYSSLRKLDIFDALKHLLVL